MTQSDLVIAHVTHEAVEQLGGIGTVLEGLMTSPVYRQHVRRSILVGPASIQPGTDPTRRLGPQGEVLYSSVDHIDRHHLADRLRPIELAFNTPLVYGRRHYRNHLEGRTGEAEVLLVDVFRTNPAALAVFKHRLWERFGLDSSRYERYWDYEEYVRLAEPAYYALCALLGDDPGPCLLLAHEFMGMPTALQAIACGRHRFRTIFHAHECSTARRILEDHPGHDVMFYNVLRQATLQGKFIADVFPEVDQFFRHALISRSHLCDAVIAVGDMTRQELQFLNPQLAAKTIDVVYNGVPAPHVDLDSRLASRRMLLQYSQTLLGYQPDVLLTHVTRPVISKGLWRDLKLCHELDRLLAADGKTGVLYILTSGGGTRSPQDVAAMEDAYGWPRHHRIGHPDLVGPEVDIFRDVDVFNQGHRATQVILVNQFGWDRQRIGRRLPQDMTMADFRRATDVELGMATYEPFGISPLEPLGSGAVCVISSVCGCEAFVRHVSQQPSVPNVLQADFTRLDHPLSIDQLKAMTRTQRDQLEQRVANELAPRLYAALPRTDAQRAALIESGQALARRMGWDQIVQHSLLPLLRRVAASGT